jgi:phage-related protein
MDELAQKTGGSAAAAADTAAGKMQIMQVAMDEAKESAGAALLPAMAGLATVMADTAQWTQKNSKLVVVLAGVVAGLATAVLLVNAALKVYQATLIVVQAVQKATWLTNPIGLVVIAIIAVVAAVVLLWRRSETFRSVVLAVWSGIRTGAQALVNFLRSAFNNVWDAVGGFVRDFAAVVRAVFATVRELVATVTAAIRERFSAVWDFVKEGARSVRDGVGDAFRAARDVVGNVSSAIRDGWQNTVSAIRGSVAGLGAILAAPFNAMKGALDSVVGAVQNLIGWLSRIKVPSIKLPSLPGFNMAPTPGAPALAVAGRGAAPAVPMGHFGGQGAGASTGPTFVINGAIDPEATARQIRRILQGHDRRVGLG